MMVFTGDVVQCHYIILEYNVPHKHIILHNTNSSKVEIKNVYHILQMDLHYFKWVDNINYHIKELTLNANTKDNYTDWTVWNHFWGEIRIK